MEQVGFTLKIKSSQKDVVTWTESNSFQQIKWLIKSELQDKQVWKFLMVNSLSVQEPTPKVFMDWMNVSRDRRVTLMQEQTWFSQKVFTLLNNSRLLLNNWRIIRKIFSFWQTWLNSERLLTLILIHLSLMDTTALFTQFQHWELLWKLLMSSLLISSKKEFKKTLLAKCKAETNFTIFSTTLQVKNGIILKLKPPKNENNFKNYFYVFYFL